MYVEVNLVLVPGNFSLPLQKRF